MNIPHLNSFFSFFFVENKYSLSQLSNHNLLCGSKLYKCVHLTFFLKKCVHILSIYFIQLVLFNINYLEFNFNISTIIPKLA